MLLDICGTMESWDDICIYIYIHNMNYDIYDAPTNDAPIRGVLGNIPMEFHAVLPIYPTSFVKISTQNACLEAAA